MAGGSPKLFEQRKSTRYSLRFFSGLSMNGISFPVYRLDVYGENARKIVPIDSPVFGRVMAVCVGAMMVGTIVTTVEEGAEVKRGDEFGYFAFGASSFLEELYLHP